jgi:hypothetical protein
MLSAVLLDNDVVLKMCAYAAATRLLEVSTFAGQPPAILRVASFALQSQVKKSRLVVDHELAAAQLAIVLVAAQILEPTDREIDYAADLEERATGLGLELDPGESQLVAVLLHRSSPLLITGDKRALRALSAVATDQVNHRMACLEQLICAAITDESLGPLRAGVCASKGIDRAVTNCFACYTEEVGLEQVQEGLTSYISAIRQQSGRLMVESNDLLAISP